MGEYDMSNEDRDRLYDYMVSVRESLTELWAAIDDGADEYDGSEPREYLDEYPLEIVWERGEPFAVVLTVGGPHVEIVGGGRNGGYRLVGHWGVGPVVLTGEAVTRTGEYFRELVSE